VTITSEEWRHKVYDPVLATLISGVLNFEHSNSILVQLTGTFFQLDYVMKRAQSHIASMVRTQLLPFMDEWVNINILLATLRIPETNICVIQVFGWRFWPDDRDHSCA